MYQFTNIAFCVIFAGKFIWLINQPDVHISYFKIQCAQQPQKEKKIKSPLLDTFQDWVVTPAPETLKPNVGVQTLHGGLLPHLMSVM